MNKTFLAVAAGMLVGGGAIAAYQVYATPYAEVLSSTPITEKEQIWGEVVASTPITEMRTGERQVCEDRVVEVRQPERFGDKDGMVVGAVVGGLLGNQVGGGTGKTLATVGGAVGGGYLGNEAQKKLTSKTVWVTQVKMKDGSIRPFETAAQPAWASGKVVRVNDQGQLVPLK